MFEVLFLIIAFILMEGEKRGCGVEMSFLNIPLILTKTRRSCVVLRCSARVYHLS